MSVVFLLGLLTCVSCVYGDAFQSTLGHLKVNTSPQIQEQAALGVIERLIPDKASFFRITIDPDLGPTDKDTFKVEKLSEESVVRITGTSGVAAVWGFHHYLKYFCNCHVSWEADQLALPTVLPSVNITITSVERFRYYQNVCTTSYSFVWWSWERWQREIDWMALNGINLALAFTGQEAIWQRVYSKLNLTQEDIDEHMSGPAFFAWLRMGNMRGFQGPLSNAWHAQSLELQHQILSHMRELGIVSVLPAFAGHVPRAFKRLFPDSPMTLMTVWNNFPDEYCCPYLLEPTDPLFRTVGNLFISEMMAEFGTDHIYNCDTFNEMRPHTSNVTYLAEVSKAIYTAMADVDPDAVWMLQGWLFRDVTFWFEAQAEAFLTSVPSGRMIILDLQSELNPQYRRLHSYFGQPFIWCMLHNFGGTLGLYGAVENVNSRVFDGRSLQNGTMVGTGLTPEGINQNYVMYDLMNEMAWRTQPVNLSQWFASYSARRYGAENEHAQTAWQLLLAGVYNCTADYFDMHGEFAICMRPSPRLKDFVWYNTTELAIAWDELLSASTEIQTVETFKHDIVDITRQVLQVLGANIYETVVSTFKANDTVQFQENAQLFLDLLRDLDALLASNKEFLLGTWLEGAKAFGTSSSEKILLEMNARNQITLWGPSGQIVDYATKQWSGVVSDYFLPRWTIFLDALNTTLMTGTAFNETVTNQRIFMEVELPFTLSNKTFPTSPQGDSIAIATHIHNKWRTHFQYDLIIQTTLT